jgi:hypothetical protein
MAVINLTQLPAFFYSIGRWLQIWMDGSAANAGSRLAGAEGVTEPWHDLGIAANEVRTLAGRWPNSAANAVGGGWRVLVSTKRHQRAGRFA